MLHGYTPPRRYLPYLSWSEIAALPDKRNTVIVLPVGATEQHGPHLPCAVDTLISAGVVSQALARLPDRLPAFAMVPISYGKSDEHLHFPGTVTLSGQTLLASVNEIGESVYRAGFRKLLFVNGHGGQPQVLEICARELRLRHGDFIVVPGFVWRVAHAAGQYLSEREKKHALHAGHAETALMLALAPETVHMERAQAHYPPLFDAPTLSPDGRPACGWSARDFGPSGVIGDPLPARAEQGRVILDSLAASWAAAITELHQLQWPARTEPTWSRAQHTGHIQDDAGPQDSQQRLA